MAFLLRDAKMDRIQETLDDIKYWEIRNGGRKWLCRDCAVETKGLNAWRKTDDVTVP